MFPPICVEKKTRLGHFKSLSDETKENKNQDTKISSL